MPEVLVEVGVETEARLWPGSLVAGFHRLSAGALSPPCGKIATWRPSRSQFCGVLSERPTCMCLGVGQIRFIEASSSPWTLGETEVKEEWQPDRNPGDPGRKEEYGVLVTARPEEQQPGSWQMCRPPPLTFH